MSFIIVACILTLFWIVSCTYLAVNVRTVGSLRNTPGLPAAQEPAVDIIVAVRNEEADLAKALLSLCHLRYHNYCLIVINDRSTDSTASILNTFTLQYPNIRVITITALPEGWLGKNHALYSGTLISEGEWILFTDADVVFHPDALNKAMAYTLDQKLDNLVIFPEIASRSAHLNSVIATFRMMLEMKLRPWQVSNPQSSAAIGVGAFGLMRRTAYVDSGTHQRIPLRPDDDLRLGVQLKQAGFKQGVLYGDDMLQLEWYTSVRQFIQGLMKNTFSVMGYNPVVAIINALAVLLTIVLPVPILLLFGGWPAHAMALLILLSQWICFALHPGMDARWWYALLIPYAGTIMIWIILRSAWLTMQQKGIYWRDSFYPLQELKKNK